MTFDVPGELRYLASHEWIRVEDDEGTVGITDFAQDELGDIVFFDLPSVGDAFEQGEQFGVVESIKAASDLYLPAAGEVVEVNDRLETEPELVNRDPYGDGWLLRIALADAADADSLLSADEYGDRTE